MTTSLDSYKWPLLEELIVADYFDTDFVLHTAESMFPNLKRFKYWGLMSSLLLGPRAMFQLHHLSCALSSLKCFTHLQIKVCLMITISGLALIPFFADS